MPGPFLAGHTTYLLKALVFAWIPLSLVCGTLLYPHTLNSSILLDYDYWCVKKLGFCISIPIAHCNKRVEFSIDTYFFHQLVQRFFQYCDEMRLSVEVVTVGFLGICRQYCCDWFPVSWRADEATPERSTPIIERWKTCQLELRPVLLGSPSTVVTRQFIRLPVTARRLSSSLFGVRRCMTDEGSDISYSLPISLILLLLVSTHALCVSFMRQNTQNTTGHVLGFIAHSTKTNGGHVIFLGISEKRMIGKDIIK